MLYFPDSQSWNSGARVGLTRYVLSRGFNVRGTGARRSRVSRIPSQPAREEIGHLLQVSRSGAHSHKVPGPDQAPSVLSMQADTGK